jgi:hypothetical protein
MTRAEHDRRKRQMNRRIREVLAVRRMMATDVMRRADAALDPPPAQSP